MVTHILLNLPEAHKNNVEDLEAKKTHPLTIHSGCNKILDNYYQMKMKIKINNYKREKKELYVRSTRVPGKFVGNMNTSKNNSSIGRM